MTLKYQDLENFVSDIKKKGYNKEIPLQHLDREIGKVFGISSYTMRNIKEKLHKFGLLFPSGSVWVFPKQEEAKGEIEEDDFSKYGGLNE